MNSLRYGTYNVANAFVDAAKSDRVLDELAKANVDICVLPEALPSDHETVSTKERFDRAGYDFQSVNNDDADGRLDARQTGMAVRRGAGVSGTPTPVRLETRNAWYLPHLMPGTAKQVEFFGVHLNDRGNDERAVQIEALKAQLSPDAEHIIVGDINADYEATALRGFSRFLGMATSFIPETQPKKLSGNRPTPGRIRSIARRMDEQSDGVTMRQLLTIGLRDADPFHRPTSIRMKFLARALDRGLVSDGIIVMDHRVEPQTVSDHALVSFTATVKD